MDKKDIIPEKLEDKDVSREKLQDKDISNKVPGLDATKKVADEKFVDVKKDLTEKVETSREKVEEKVEGLKH
ncbi:MAG TPA: hypothetical protein VFZ04_20050 [Longimicrobiales bacterium]